MTQPARAGSTKVRALGWTSFLTDLSSEAIYPLLPAEDLGVSRALVPLVWFGISAIKSTTAAWAGPLVDRLAPRRALVAGWLAFAAAYAGLVYADALPVAVACMLGVVVVYGVVEPAERSLVASLSPAGRHGTAFGWYALVQGLMALPAGLIAGWPWDRGPDGPTTAFAVTAALAATAAVLLAVTGRAHQPRPA
jgi:MFS family permease